MASLVGAVDGCGISNMAAQDATTDIVTEYKQPMELPGAQVVLGWTHVGFAGEELPTPAIHLRLDPVDSSVGKPGGSQKLACSTVTVAAPYPRVSRGTALISGGLGALETRRQSRVRPPSRVHVMAGGGRRPAVGIGAYGTGHLAQFDLAAQPT